MRRTLFNPKPLDKSNDSRRESRGLRRLTGGLLSAAVLLSTPVGYAAQTNANEAAVDLTPVAAKSANGAVGTSSAGATGEVKAAAQGATTTMNVMPTVDVAAKRPENSEPAHEFLPMVTAKMVWLGRMLKKTVGKVVTTVETPIKVVLGKDTAPKGEPAAAPAKTTQVAMVGTRPMMVSEAGDQTAKAPQMREVSTQMIPSNDLAAKLMPGLAVPGQSYTLTAEDSALLDEVQRRAVLYFVEQSDPVTGLTRDRAPTNGVFSKSPSSIAATGFALTAYCIADQRGWMSTGEARRRALQALRFVANEHEQERGWFYHFVGAADGKRLWKSEASTIDTALFLQGALMAREYLHDPEVTELVDRIYGRIDWRWALNGGTTLSHGWRPETGFITSRWDSFAEMMGLYLLGLGAPEHALPVETWTAWRREPVVTTSEGHTFIQCPPLFTHQYAQAWFDFRGKRDAYTDYYQNSVDATLAQRTWSAAQNGRYPYWSENMWGLTSSDSEHGYVAWGTPIKATRDHSDGTLVPCAPGGSLPFAPKECLTSLHSMRKTGGEHLWGRYGFADAFNPQSGWVGTDVIGIDVGITLVMAENLRTGMVWKTFMRAPEVQRGMKLAGFSETAPVAGTGTAQGNGRVAVWP